MDGVFLSGSDRAGVEADRLDVAEVVPLGLGRRWYRRDDLVGVHPVTRLEESG